MLGKSQDSRGLIARMDRDRSVYRAAAGAGWGDVEWAGACGWAVNSGQQKTDSITIGRNCRNLATLGDLRRLPQFPCVHKRCLRVSKLSMVGIGCCLLSSGRNHVLTSAARFMEELTSVGLGCLKKIVSEKRVRCFDPPTKTVVSSISTDVS